MAWSASQQVFDRELQREHREIVLQRHISVCCCCGVVGGNSGAVRAFNLTTVHAEESKGYVGGQKRRPMYSSRLVAQRLRTINQKPKHDKAPGETRHACGVPSFKIGYHLVSKGKFAGLLEHACKGSPG